jgi:hypothetical protein
MTSSISANELPGNLSTKVTAGSSPGSELFEGKSGAGRSRN